MRAVAPAVGVARESGEEEKGGHAWHAAAEIRHEERGHEEIGHEEIRHEERGYEAIGSYKICNTDSDGDDSRAAADR